MTRSGVDAVVRAIRRIQQAIQATQDIRTYATAPGNGRRQAVTPPPLVGAHGFTRIAGERAALAPFSDWASRARHGDDAAVAA